MEFQQLDRQLSRVGVGGVYWALASLNARTAAVSAVGLVVEYFTHGDVGSRRT